MLDCVCVMLWDVELCMYGVLHAGLTPLLEPVANTWRHTVSQFASGLLLHVGEELWVPPRVMFLCRGGSRGQLHQH